jgi:hypothetical protein
MGGGDFPTCSCVDVYSSTYMYESKNEMCEKLWLHFMAGFGGNYYLAWVMFMYQLLSKYTELTIRQ